MTLLLGGGCAPETEADEALQALVDRVLIPSGVDPETAVVHEVGFLRAGTELAVAFGDPVDVPEDGTLFLVDRTPLASWAHDVDWVWVEADGGLRSESHEFYPLVGEEGFFPSFHPSVWGAPWEPVDPETVADLVTSLVQATGTLREVAKPADSCNERPRKALVVAGDLRLDHLVAHRQWSEALSARGYEVQTLVPTSADPVTPDDVTAAVGSYGGERLEELVLVYTGHGGPGTMAFGDVHPQGTLDHLALAGVLGTVETTRLVLVLDTCHSGSFTDAVPALRQSPRLRSAEIVVHAAARAEEFAWGTTAAFAPVGSAFTQAFLGQLSPSPEDIPWSSVALGTISLSYRVVSDPMVQRSTNPQTHTVAISDACAPRVLLAPHPDTGDCLAAWIDTQAYDRRVYLDGVGFGEERGDIAMYDEQDNLRPVDVVWWNDDAVLLELPMRADGFAANGVSPVLEGGTTVPAPGTYGIVAHRRVVDPLCTDQNDSSLERVRLEYQVYEQLWTPQVSPDDFPDWVELWHPYGEGGTIQLSRTWNAARESSPIPADLVALDAAASEPHHTTAGVIGVGPWYYDVEPGVRNLGTAYDQSQPETQYWGFRAAFGSDDVDPDPWGFTLIYD